MSAKSIVASLVILACSIVFVASQWRPRASSSTQDVVQESRVEVDKLRMMVERVSKQPGQLEVDVALEYVGDPLESRWCFLRPGFCCYAHYWDAGGHALQEEEVDCAHVFDFLSRESQRESLAIVLHPPARARTFAVQLGSSPLQTKPIDLP